jgi:hypothetical protein
MRNIIKEYVIGYLAGGVLFLIYTPFYIAEAFFDIIDKFNKKGGERNDIQRI